MKIMRAKNLLAAVLAGSLTAMNTLAQNSANTLPSGQSHFNYSLSLASADDGTAGRGGNADNERTQETEAAKEAELVKETLNPVASLISVPIQNNWDFGIGPADAMKYTANIQPVIPITLNNDWNLISRTIMPVIYQESRFTGDGDHSGLGDISQNFFLSPKNPVGGWIMGAGPVFLFPSASDSVLGAGKWGAGPTAVVLQQRDGWTYGILANQIWSFAGWGNQNVNASYLQPFVAYSTKTYTTFGVNTEATRDWQGNQWSVPMNFSITQMLKIRGQFLSVQLGYRYYVDGPTGGPDWGLRFAVTLLFPKK